jgi:hypothetical protein
MPIYAQAKEADPNTRSNETIHVFPFMSFSLDSWTTVLPGSDAGGVLSLIPVSVGLRNPAPEEK